MKVNGKDDIPYIMEDNKCLKPPTRLDHQKKRNMIKGSLGGETSVLRTFRMSGKELVKERVSKERVRQGKS